MDRLRPNIERDGGFSRRPIPATPRNRRVRTTCVRERSDSHASFHLVGNPVIAAVETELGEHVEETLDVVHPAADVCDGGLSNRRLRRALANHDSRTRMVQLQHLVIERSGGLSRFVECDDHDRTVELNMRVGEQAVAGTVQPGHSRIKLLNRIGP